MSDKTSTALPKMLYSRNSTCAF